MLHGELLGRRQTKPHPLSTRRERVWLGALRRNRLTMMSRNFLRLGLLLVSAAPWTADHRGGEGSALLRWSCLQPLLCRGREFGAWSFLFDGQRRLWRGTRCRCGLSVPLPQLLLLLHHLPDLLHLLLPLHQHLLLSHLLPLLDPLAPRTSVGFHVKARSQSCFPFPPLVQVRVHLFWFHPSLNTALISAEFAVCPVLLSNLATPCPKYAPDLFGNPSSEKGPAGIAGDRPIVEVDCCWC